MSVLAGDSPAGQASFFRVRQGLGSVDPGSPWLSHPKFHFYLVIRFHEQDRTPTVRVSLKLGKNELSPIQ
jgi:hypothetical protein